MADGSRSSNLLSVVCHACQQRFLGQVLPIVLTAGQLSLEFASSALYPLLRRMHLQLCLVTLCCQLVLGGAMFVLR